MKNARSEGDSDRAASSLRALSDGYLDCYDGAEILKWLSANAPHVRRVMLTGDSGVRTRDSYAEKVLIKPAYVDAIQQAVGVW